MAKSGETLALALVCSTAISVAVQVPFSFSATQAAAPAVQAAKERSPDASAGPFLPAEAWNADELLASPEVVKEASPQPVMDGAQLTYTLHVTHTGAVTLTDILPAQVTPSGNQTWTTLIKPGHASTQALAVTVTEDYSGPLTNRVQVTTAEGARGSTSLTMYANACTAVLPGDLREYSSGLPPQEWDPRLDDLGVKLEPASIEPGEPFWRLVAAQWADPSEPAGRHNVFFRGPGREWGTCCGPAGGRRMAWGRAGHIRQAWPAA